ncbi:MAG: hypothetical protein HOH74_13735 [Gemmatimonadetes bacterium]|jgi:hypothetical protein|nr:hypothetical protein [Gemmatimonadota bacterium]
MRDLRDYIWLRDQWRRFRHVLIGALTSVLILCTSGLVLLRDDEDPTAWLFARLALMLMLVVSTMVALWLWYKAGREIRNLSQLATEARLEAARLARESPEQKKGRRRG